MSVSRSVSRSVSLAAVVTAGILLLAGCGSGDGSADPYDDAGDADAAGGTAEGYPKKIENCGRTVTVERPPQRAVSLNQDSTEILLSLGLADRMAGTATWTDPVLKHLAKDNAKVPRLANNNPSFEKVLSTEPDFVTASFESTLGKGGIATRDDFSELGVESFVSPSDCAKSDTGDGDGSRDRKLRMSDIYGEVEDLAAVFGVEKRGEKLIASLKERTRKATRDVKASKASVLYWFANSEAPYMAGCCGAPGIITDAVGAQNVFDDTHDEWPQINWETVADRNPDVLVVGDLTRDRETAETARKKIEFLASNPATKNMDAVRNHRYVALSGASMNPSIRTVEGIEKVAAALREHGLAG